MQLAYRWDEVNDESGDGCFPGRPVGGPEPIAKRERDTLFGKLCIVTCKRLCMDRTL